MRTIKTASISEHLKHDAGKVTLRMDRETADVLYKAAQMYSNILSGNLDPVSISVRMNKSGLSCSQVDLANQKTAEKFLQSAKTTLFPELSGTGRHAHTYTTESTLNEQLYDAMRGVIDRPCGKEYKSGPQVTVSYI